MATLYDVARHLYMGKGASMVGRAATVGGVIGGAGGSTSSLRYGYAVEDSVDGWVKVQLDTSGIVGEPQIVTCVCDSPIKNGQRVAVDVLPSGQLRARPIGDNIIGQVEQDVAEQIQEAGQAILDEVNGEMEDFKADHQLTDADIQHSITTAVSGATETWEAQLTDVEDGIEQNYALKTEVTQGINGLKSEIEENYTTSEGVTNEINTAISQASGQIQSTVEQNVMNSVGDTFATKTELTQTSTSLQLNINQAVNTANDAASDASDALSTAQEVESYFTFDGTGLEVGRTGNASSVKMNSNGSFQVIDENTPVLNIYGSGSKYTQYYSRANIMTPSDDSTIVISCGDVSSNLYAGVSFNMNPSSGFTFESSSGHIGFDIDGCRYTEVTTASVSNTTSTTTVNMPETVSSPTACVLYYRFSGSTTYDSVKFEVSGSSTRYIQLICAQEASPTLYLIGERLGVSVSGKRVTISRSNNLWRVALTPNAYPGVNLAPTGSYFYIEQVTLCG